MVRPRAESRGGSRAEASGTAQPLGGGDGLAPTAVRRIEVEELGRLGDHRAGSFAFDESRWFETYRTTSRLVKQKLGKSAIVLVTVR
jgi:hypothetical protein